MLLATNILRVLGYSIKLLFSLSVLSNCKIVSGGNLALRQPTEISSVYSSTTTADKAVDGNPRTDNPYGAETYFTKADVWWRVDLGRSYVIDDVYILPRNHTCCWARNNGAVITVGDDINGVVNKQCCIISGSPSQKSFKCSPPLRGRYLTIYKKYTTGDEIQVALYEVMVNENPTENLAKGKSTAQSSMKDNGSSSKAVDGNRDASYYVGSCSHTALDQPNPWWRVDLGSSQPVSEVFIVNRHEAQNRLDNIEIRVGDSLSDNGNINPRCGGIYSMAKLYKASFYCKPRKTGRYVSIRLVGQQMTLTLCEVEVYSESKAIIPNRPANQLTANLIQHFPPQLTCPEPFGFPVPYIAFYHNGVMVSNSSSVTMVISENTMSNRRNDSVWECVVTNKHGSDFYQFNVEGSYKMCAKYQDLIVTDWSINIQASTYSNNNAVINNHTWYRLTDGHHYLQLPETCVSPYHCSTQASGWMKGPHPTKQDLVLQRTVCFSWQGNCCYHNITILVRRCHGYFVYKLETVTLDVQAGYCTVLSSLRDPSIMFQSGTPDHLLLNHVINTEQGLSLTECISVCLSHHGCQSVNHNRKTQVCEMNNSTRHQSRDQEWRERSGNQYHELQDDVMESIEL